MHETLLWLGRPEDSVGNESVILREFVSGDENSVVKLSTELGLSHWSEQDYLAEASQSQSHFLVAVIESEVVGFIVGRFVPGTQEAELRPDAEIYNIGVDTARQRSGIGNLLLRNFLDECRSGNVNFVWLEVRKMNLKAISFYESIGFEQFAERPRFYKDPPDDGMVMRLEM